MAAPVAHSSVKRTAPPSPLAGGRTHKTLPHNLDAEASILGGVLLRNEVLASIPELQTEDFYDFRHKIVWEAIRNLEAAHKPIDVTTLEVEIDRHGRLESLGGIAFLGDLLLRVPTAENVRAYTNEVLAHSRHRQVWLTLAGQLERVQNWAHDPIEVLDETLGELERVRTGDRLAAGGAATSYGGNFLAWLGDTEPSADPADTFDAHGLIVHAEPSLFIGDPKVGKTLIVEDLALHLAAGRKSWCDVPLYRRCKVLAFLREDSEQTSRRRIFQMTRGAGIDHWELDGWLEVDAVSPLYFDKPQHVAALARKIRPFDVVLIDSLSTIHNGDENSVESMAPVMNVWRDLALTTKTAIAIIHHFRKRLGDGKPAEPGGGVLQRARGSSIIGATTRHAVGISSGPERGQVVIDVESNHDVHVEPFVIQRVSGISKDGRAFLRHERLGSLRDAKSIADSNKIDPIVLAVVRDAGEQGIRTRDMRTLVADRMREQYGSGCRGDRVDYSARRLEREGRIQHLDVAKRWRFIA